jgi:alpha-beta hydrolase superfamily lysophospholipase
MRRIFKRAAWILGGVMLAGSIAWVAARPAEPDAFYLPPSAVPQQPGALLRQEPFDRKVPPGSVAWRILYSTLGMDGHPAVASAIVMMARTAPAGPRPVIAYAHGTTGVMPGCAPSLSRNPFENVPAVPELLRRGWIYVATDYVGQGVAGPHPYLIGEGEGRSVLDSIRALHQMEEVHASDRVVVWGHSQGGNAALWTGILSATYAPEISIAGVAALAPATNLPALVDVDQYTVVGRMLSSMILRAYSDVYPDVEFNAYSSGWKRLVARDMSARCLFVPEALTSVAESVAAGRTIYNVAGPISGALGRRLAENTPDRPIRQPLLIAQGLTDDLVLPEIQSQFVSRRCAAGQSLEYRRYAGRTHISMIAGDSPLLGDLLAWTKDRLSGVPVSDGCRDILH